MGDKKFEQDYDVKYFWKFPYRWKINDLAKDLWNPKEERVFPPKQFGLGWGLNFASLFEKFKKRKDSSEA